MFDIDGLAFRYHRFQYAQLHHAIGGIVQSHIVGGDSRLSALLVSHFFKHLFQHVPIHMQVVQCLYGTTFSPSEDDQHHMYGRHLLTVVSHRLLLAFVQ